MSQQRPDRDENSANQYRNGFGHFFGDTAALAERTGASARGLLRDSIEQSSSGAVTDSLASSNTNASKASPSSSSGATVRAHTSLQTTSAHNEHPGSSHYPGDGSFRCQRNDSGAYINASQRAFDDFASESGISMPVVGSLEASSSSGKRSLLSPHPATLDSMGTASRRLDTSRELDGSRCSGDPPNDGAAVVALLSNPHFNVDNQPADSWALEANTQNGENHYGFQPHDDSEYLGKTPAQTNPLELIPDFGTLPALSSQRQSCTLGGHRFDEAEQASIPDTQSGDLQPWRDMLSKYQDEVWGDMLPLVQEARREIEVVENGPKGSVQDRPALRRLVMLLGHLKYPNTR